jgi:hypothetical protein
MSIPKHAFAAASVTAWLALQHDLQDGASAAACSADRTSRTIVVQEENIESAIAKPKYVVFIPSNLSCQPMGTKILFNCYQYSHWYVSCMLQQTIQPKL